MNDIVQSQTVRKMCSNLLALDKDVVLATGSRDTWFEHNRRQSASFFSMVTPDKQANSRTESSNHHLISYARDDSV